MTSVVELDEFTHRATRFAGGWQAYLDEKAAAERHAWERFEEYDTKRSALAGAGPARARVGDAGAGQGAPLGRDATSTSATSAVNQTEQLAGRAARTERAIARLDVVDKPRVPWELRLDIARRRPQR